jgi:hypothetical protein
MQREALSGSAVFLTVHLRDMRAIGLRRAPGNERRQAGNVRFFARFRLGLGLRLRLRSTVRIRLLVSARLEALFARLMLIVAILVIAIMPLVIAVPVLVVSVAVLVVAILVVAILVLLFARLIVLRLGDVVRLALLAVARLAHAALHPIIVAVVVATAVGALILGPEIRIGLPELLLRGRDHAEVVFGVLVVIFRRNGIARGLRVTRQLEVLIGDVVGGAADLHVGPVGLVDAGERILSLATVVVAATHTLVVVLTVSHRLASSTSEWRGTDPRICCRRADACRTSAAAAQLAV